MKFTTNTTQRRLFCTLSILLAAAACGGQSLETDSTTATGSGGSGGSDASGGSDTSSSTGTAGSGGETGQVGITVIDADVGNYYDDLPDYANLAWIEDWELEAEITGPVADEQTAGAIRGAVEVIEYQGSTHLYVADLGGVRTFTSNSGLSWDNAVSPMNVPIGGEDSPKYSHPYAEIDANGQMHMFLQTLDQSDEQGQFYISHTTSDDGLSFSEPQSFLACEELLADYHCNSCAHGRITPLPAGGYAIAFSTSCQRDEFPAELGLTFVPGTMMAYSDDLVSWEIDPATYFPACHDPAFDVSQGKVYLYCASEVALLPPGATDGDQRGQLLRYDSEDGRTWTPKTPAGMVRFWDEDGEQIHRVDWNIADVDVHDFGADGVRMYTAADAGGYPSVFAFQRP